MFTSPCFEIRVVVRAACAALLAAAVPAQDTDPLAGVLDQLREPASRPAALAALAKAPAEAALGVLCRGILEADEVVAWQAMLALQSLPFAGIKPATLAAAGAGLRDAVGKANGDVRRRITAAFALGRLGGNDADAAASLVTVVHQEAPIPVRWAAAAALGFAGERACQSIGKHKQGADAIATIGLSAAVIQLGKRAGAGRAWARDVLEREPNKNSLVCCLAAHAALQAATSGNAADDALAAMVKAVRKHKKPLVTKVNLWAPMLGDSKSAALSLNQGLGSPAPANVEGFAVPSTIPGPLWLKAHCMADACQSIALHLATELAAAGAEVRKGGVGSVDAWFDRLALMQNSGTMLAAIE
jgi:hypothetical protein